MVMSEEKFTTFFTQSVVCKLFIQAIVQRYSQNESTSAWYMNGYKPKFHASISASCHHLE
jgi:hypothetical protein